MVIEESSESGFVSSSVIEFMKCRETGALCKSYKGGGNFFMPCDKYGLNMV